jgi:hypothetical protein
MAYLRRFRNASLLVLHVYAHFLNRAQHFVREDQQPPPEGCGKFIQAFLRWVAARSENCPPRLKP